MEEKGNFLYTKDAYESLLVKEVDKTSFNPEAVSVSPQESCFTSYEQMLKCKQQMAKHYASKTSLK